MDMGLCAIEHFRQLLCSGDKKVLIALCVGVQIRRKYFAKLGPFA